MNFTPIAGCVDCCLRFILLFAVFILVRDYFLMVLSIIVYSFESNRRCASHRRCTSSRHHQYIFVQSYTFFNKQQSFYGKIIKKTEFCANKYKKCIIYRKHTDVIQAEEKQKKEAYQNLTTTTCKYCTSSKKVLQIKNRL